MSRAKIISLFANDLANSGLNYPASDGTSGQVIITDGAGNLSFSDIDSAYVQLRQTPQDFSYSSLTGAPTTLSSFTNDTNYLDSTTVQGVIDASYIQANQTTYDFLDSAEAISLIDSAYINARVNVSVQGLDSSKALDLIDSAYIQARQITGDFLDSAEAIALIDSNYVQARQSSVGDTTFSLSLHQQGTLEILTGSVRWYAPSDLTFSKITSRIGATADATVTAVVKKNGTSVLTLSITASNTSVVDNTGFSMIEGDYLTIDVTAVGSSSSPGEDLNVQFIYTLD